MKTKMMIPSMVMVVALLLAVACSSAPAAPPPAPAAPTTAATAPAAAKAPADYPKQPLKFIVQYPAGGGTDVTARLVAKYAEKYVGQNIVIENIAGASGVLGSTQFANAKPDGYTIGLIFSTTSVEKSLLENVTYSLDSFDSICQVNFEPAQVVVKAGGPYDKPIKDILAAAKNTPVTAAIGAVWTEFDFLRLLLQNQSGGQMTRVGFQGGGPATKAVLAGDVAMSFNFPSEWMSYQKTGELKGAGGATEKPWPGFEMVPTFRSMGYNIGDLGARRVLAAPKGMPEERLAFLESAFMQALADPALGAEFQKLGMGLVPAGRKEAASLLKTQADVYAKLVQQLGLKPGDVPK